MKAGKQKTKHTAVQPGVASRIPWMWLVAAAVALFVLMQIYDPALNGPFVFDDQYLAFQDAGFLQTGVTSFSPTSRPLTNFSYWLNLRYFGMTSTYSFHLTNVIFHFLNGLLIFAAVRKLLEYAGQPAGRVNIPAAVAALVFLLHPVQTESVAYVAGRSESFSLIWFLSAYTLFLYNRRGGIGWGASLGVIVLFGAAFLSKEHTAVLPALLILTDIFFPEGKPVETIKRNWRLYAPMLVMAAAGAVLVVKVLAKAETAGFGMKDLPWHHYFFTQWRAVWVYLRLFVLPFDLNADYDFAISRTPFDHLAILGLLGLLALIAVAFRYRNRYPLVLFGLLMFLLLLAPTSSIVPIRDPLAERRMYLPFLGLLLVGVDFYRQWNAAQGTKLTAMGVVLALLSGLTFWRAAVWGNEEQLWKDTVSKSAGKSRPHFQLAMVYFEQKRCAEAVKEFAETERVSTEKAYSLYVDWGLAYDCLNQQELALQKFHQAVAIQTNGHTRSLVGMALGKLQRYAESLEELNEAAKLEPNYDMTYYYRGVVYLLTNNLDKAQADFEKCLSISPNNEQARKNLDQVLRRKGILK
jgi:tetratricopeptide (TPR) repeat protein